MPAEYARSDQFRGARIHLSDLAGLEIRDCEVDGLKIVDCYGSDVYLGGDFERLVVNDVDVTDYVESELDRQHPARALARSSTSTWPGPDQRGLSRLMQVMTGTCAPSIRATQRVFWAGAQLPSGRPVRMVGL